MVLAFSQQLVFGIGSCRSRLGQIVCSFLLTDQTKGISKSKPHLSSPFLTLYHNQLSSDEYLMWIRSFNFNVWNGTTQICQLGFFLLDHQCILLIIWITFWFYLSPKSVNVIKLYDVTVWWNFDRANLLASGFFLYEVEVRVTQYLDCIGIQCMLKVLTHVLFFFLVVNTIVFYESNPWTEAVNSM